MDSRILIWNCEGWKNKYVALRKNLVKEEINVGIITENKLTNLDMIRIASYNISRKERNGEKGGDIVILIKKGTKWVPIKDRDIKCSSNRIEAKGVRIMGSKKDLYLIEIYRKPVSK